MGVIWHDLATIAQEKPTAITDNDYEDEAGEIATAEQGLILGPAVLADYYRQGYAWAAVEDIIRITECPGDNLAYRDGCAAYVVQRPADQLAALSW
jgi:hypothetical protein